MLNSVDLSFLGLKYLAFDAFRETVKRYMKLERVREISLLSVILYRYMKV